MRIIGVIPARMASSRFPGKPLAAIRQKPMLEWVYENAIKSNYLNDVLVATDDQKIMDHCNQNNMKVLMTSPDHKNCSERTTEVSKKIQADFYVEIQGDEPVLYSDMIDAFISKSIFCKDETDLCISCTHVRPDEDINDVNLVKIVMDQNNNALYFSRLPIPLNFKNNQPVKYYKQIGLYFWSAESLQRFSNITPGLLEQTEDTHTLRFIENHFKVRMIYNEKGTASVDVPDDIKKVEDFLNKAGN